MSEEHIVEIHADHAIVFKERANLPQENKIFFVVQDRDHPKADINLFFHEKRIEVKVNRYPASSKVMEYLRTTEQSKLKEMYVVIQDEVSNIHSFLSDTTTRVLSLIKYHLSYSDIEEQLFTIKSRHWRISGQDWKYLPSKLGAAMVVNEVPLFDVNTCRKIQDSLDQGVIPLVGMRHLHRAKNESLPHYKWIDATIAAELTIKEVLIRARPELEPLINEVPSPPLTKLYGQILEAYLGQRSPYLKEIGEGVEIRNRLLHKASSEIIGRQKANNYVDNIEKAIFHLMSLLYPENELWKVRAERFAEFPIKVQLL